MKNTLNEKGQTPVDIIREKEDTELKTKLMSKFEDKVLVAVASTEDGLPHLLVT